MKKNSVVSLFSGGGGLDIGFLNRGFELLWAIELNKNAANTYRENIGSHIINSDINKIDIDSIPNADIIIGGPPCQSFSLAGKRDSKDKRGKLIWRFLEIIEIKRPKLFLFENVTGFLSAKDKYGNRVIELLTEKFKNLGYTLNVEVLNSADYGVPQKRKRVFIVGVLGNDKYVFPKSTHGEGKEKYITVSEALSDLPSPRETEQTYYKSEPQNNYQKYIRKNNKDYVTEHLFPQMSELDQYIANHVKPGGNYMDIPSDVNSKRIRRLQKEGGRTTCYGRMDPYEPSYTINTYFNRPNVGCNIHYEENRLITIREAMRLQSFPDNYKLISTTKKDKYLIVGNAVPPLLAEQLALSVETFFKKGNKYD